ncbi:hypothetical protein ACFL60_00975 [Candidatus Omnitrophota bacterium]
MGGQLPVHFVPNNKRPNTAVQLSEKTGRSTSFSEYNQPGFPLLYSGD